ncbi:MAG: hypothetical protein R3F14_43365 [Polyangiaceae bacterium]
MSRTFLKFLVPATLSALCATAAIGCGSKGSGSDSAQPGAGPTPAAATPDIAGSYTVKGTNPGNSGDYSGSLVVTKRGDVYQFSWKTGATSYDGVGVQSESSIGVAFASGAEGNGCSVVQYKLGADGSLQGKWGQWGGNAAGTESATRSGGGTGVDGNYDVTGTRLDGKPYKGTLTVTPEGAGHLFAWSTGDASQGFGIQSGSSVSVGIGGGECGFVAYDVLPDGTLKGQWSSFKSKAIGTEVATKAK